MPSSIYRTIWQSILQRKQTVFSYQGKPREAFPIVLGYSADGREVLAAYQVGGETSRGKKLPAWRCFYLAEVLHLKTRDAEWREGDSHKQSQTCVQFVDVDVNIPDTLTRPEPLSAGSILLQPPRRRK